MEPCAHCDARSHSVCNAIGDRYLARLASLTQVIEAPPGTTFISEGEPANHFFNITRGTAKLFKLLPDGRRQITGFATVGHFLGLAVSDTYAFSAEALEPTRYCRFSRSKLRQLLDDFPAMEARLLQAAANELVAAQEQMLLLGRKTARERLASFLVTQNRQSTPCGQPRARFPLPMTRGDIADYLGLTIETVSRTLTVLRKEGLIDIPGPGVLIVCDRPALERVAGGLT
ncbi:MAG TPA: helix-turn-helix domain-containing protein [Acetobacteraceae bacterium]|nr:helix-turn-helix domain-containing protein [Acetobacteraceae bacterium]